MVQENLYNGTIEVPLTFGKLHLPEEELMTALGYEEGRTPSEDVQKMINIAKDAVRKCCRPRFAYRIVHGRVSGRQHIEIEGMVFKPDSIIVHNLKESESFALLVGTVGEEMTDWMHSPEVTSDIMLSFIADSMGSVIAESIISWGMEHVAGTIKGYGLGITNSYSPGYCGWHVSEQHKFFGLLTEGVCGISLCESGLMTPVKSVSSIIGIGEKAVKRDYICNICRKKDCYRRKYDHRA